MNDERPTPETDAFMRTVGTPWHDFARKLERQRDEAREELKAMREAIKIAHAALPFNQWEALAKLKPFLP